MTAESIPIKWTHVGTPVQLIWLIDAAVREPLYVSGKLSSPARPSSSPRSATASV
jgi:hypothetical protein